MASVRKAVIPVAGLGTRFLPVTKAMPKELLPIVTTPTLQIVAQEAAASGLKEIILITSPQKPEIESYFRNDTFSDKRFAEIGKESALAELYALIDRLKITAVSQETPKGLGHAVLCAKDAVGGESFVVLLPDVIIESAVPCSKQLIETYGSTGISTCATEHTPPARLHLYGIYDIEKSDGRLHRTRGVVEKPTPANAPSDFSVVGRYLFTPEIFDVLETTKPGRNNEIQLADAMDALAKNRRLVAYEYDGRQFDTGDPAGYIEANIFYGRRTYGAAIDEFMRGLIGKPTCNDK